MKRAIVPLLILAAAAAASLRAPSISSTRATRPAATPAAPPAEAVRPSTAAAVPVVDRYRAAKERRDWREMKRLRSAATAADYDPAHPLLSAELLEDSAAAVEPALDWNDPAQFRYVARYGGVRGSAHLASVLQTHPDLETRRAAALALGRHGAPEVLVHLETIPGPLADFAMVKMHLRGVIEFPEHRLAGLDADNLALLRGEALPEEPAPDRIPLDPDGE